MGETTDEFDMTIGTLIIRSLRFYWRTHLGVLLGVVVTCAILTGALAVGDSVRHSLERLALSRLGSTALALTSPDRFFRAQLADKLANELQTNVAPVLLLRGAVSRPDGRARANDVQVIGVEEHFWQLGASSNLLAPAAADEVVINARVAEQLGARRSDVVVVRVEQPALISRDAPLSGRSDAAVALRLRVCAIADDAEFGRFSLRANQTPPSSLFIPISILQAQLKRAGQANVLLTAAERGADAVLRCHWTVADAGLEVRSLPDSRTTELRSAQVFLDPVIEKAALALSSNATGVLSYFVNELRCGERTTPYSFITAVNHRQGDDEITLNTWLAEDLGAKPGDAVALRYFVIGERRELREATAHFRVHSIAPLTADDSWMPAFPGLAEVHNCRDWAPGIPIANERIRPKDEAYWNKYGGTPKAFINLAAGQKLWGNRFGQLTAVRYPAAELKPADLEKALIAKIDPAALGLFFVPVREQALAASRQALDFGQLFIGFSFFLIVAALLLTAMLFSFHLEQRHEEVGLLRALGFRPGQVRRLLWLEGFALAAMGTVAGTALGVCYTRLTLLGLSTIWRDAAGAIALDYYAAPFTLVLGAVLSLLTAAVAMALVQRSQAKRAPAELLAGGSLPEMSGPAKRANGGFWAGVIAAGMAAAMLVSAGHERDQQTAEIFFSAGACLLIAGLGFGHCLLVALGQTTQASGSLAMLGLRNAARRRRRSLTTISVLASGVFLLVAVSAFHQDAKQTARERHSGTGGFALFAQSALPVYDDLNSQSGRDSLGLSTEELRGVSILPLRVREGDDASCLNLNRAQQPRLWGVRPDELEKRQAFAFSDKNARWSWLDRHEPDGAVPAIGDEQTVVWALGKKLGETLPFTDDHGEKFTIRIVGILNSSLLQGGLVISEQNFIARFPAAAGYRAFLVDTPPERADTVAGALSRALQNRGLEVVPAWRRLAEFMMVENTYLGIFQVLGGLGLVLGSLGLGIVVLRNVLERRNELALLMALGFRRRALQRLVLSEHWLLIFLGLTIGLLAAVLAVWPVWIAAGTAVPVVLLTGTLGGLAAGGLLWTWLAAHAALRGPLLQALRNE